MDKVILYIKNLFKRRKAVVFTIFIIFSCVFWVLIKFSDTYSANVTVKLAYENIPDNKVLLGNPPKELDLQVNAQGFDILSRRFFMQTIFVDLSNTDDDSDRMNISVSQIEKIVRNQLDSDIQLQRVAIDSLVLKFGLNKEKNVTIRPQIDINFRKDFELYDELKITPAEIQVWGPEDILDTLTHLRTEKITLNDIHENINTDITVSLGNFPENLKVKTKTVNVRGVVKRFSEHLLTVPITVINVPDSISVQVFPTEVNVLYRASLDDIKIIQANDFKVVCDFNNVNETSDYMIPTIVSTPLFLKKADLQQQKIEYLIKKE